jgi:ferredoxin
MEAATAVVIAVAIAAALALVPPLLRRRRHAARPPSVVDPDRCVGCDQCAIDCPYGAITMVDRSDGRPHRLASVDQGLCVSCGICAGSCSPMGVGPPGRSGRDQLARAREFLADSRRRPGEMIVVCCAHGAGALAGAIAGRGAVPYPVDCAGNLHTSVIELLLRGGVGGVLVLACPPRDCWNREGARWVRERIYDGREAELQERVSRDRVALAHAGARERTLAEEAIDRFATRLSALGEPPAATAMADDARCGAAAADAP